MPKSGIYCRARPQPLLHVPGRSRKSHREAPRQGSKRVAQIPSLPAITGPGPQQGMAHLRVSGSVAEQTLARMFSTRSVPYEKTQSRSAASAEQSIWHGRGSDRRRQRRPGARCYASCTALRQPVAGDGDGARPLQPQSAGHGFFGPDDDHAALTSGMQSARWARLPPLCTWSLNTTSLTEFQPLLTAMGSPPPPVELAGAANFNGNVQRPTEGPADRRPCAGV